MCSRALGILALAMTALSPRAGFAQDTPPSDVAPSAEATPPAAPAAAPAAAPDAGSPATSPTTPPPPALAPVRYRLWAGVAVLGLGVAGLGGAVYFARRVSTENGRAEDLLLEYEDALIHGRSERARQICMIFDANGTCLKGELEDADAAGTAAVGNYNLTLALGLGLSLVGGGLIAWDLSGLGTGDSAPDTGKAPNWRLDVTPLSGGGLFTFGGRY